MFRSKLTPTILAVVAITVICFISLGESKSILLNLPLPPIPESRAVSQQLELSLQNGTQMECTATLDSGFSIRNGIIGSRYRWKNFNIFPDPAYDDRERALINNAAHRLQQAVPCVRFGIFPRGARPSGDYVHIKKASGCWSYIGKLGGRQDMSLANGCLGIGTIMHEMIHALGFWHEQSRHDRDDFVNILWQNIRPGMEHNFQKHSASKATTFGVRYNQRGIMHYGGRDFSKNGQPTITAKNGGAVGSTGNLEATDIQKLRKMYNC